MSLRQPPDLTTTSIIASAMNQAADATFEFVSQKKLRKYPSVWSFGSVCKILRLAVAVLLK